MEHDVPPRSSSEESAKQQHTSAAVGTIVDEEPQDNIAETAAKQPPVPCSSSGSSSSSSKKKKPAPRCQTCKRKLGLTGFACRCGGFYCGLHRYANTHQCSFDYRRHGQEQIRKNNPPVHAEKISKI